MLRLMTGPTLHVAEVHVLAGEHTQGFVDLQVVPKPVPVPGVRFALPAA